MNIFERLANTCEYLQMLENDIQAYRSSYKRLCNFSVFNTNIAQSPRVSPNGIKNHIFHCASHISSSVMAEAVRQVATLAILVSQHTVVIHNAIVALQQYRERQQQEQVQRRRRRRTRRQQQEQVQRRRRRRRRQQTVILSEELPVTRREIAALTLLQPDGEPSRKRLWLGVPGRLF